MTPAEAHLVESATDVLTAWFSEGSGAALEAAARLAPQTATAVQLAPRAFTYLGAALTSWLALISQSTEQEILCECNVVAVDWFGVPVDGPAARGIVLTILAGAVPEPTGMDVPTAVVSTMGLCVGLVQMVVGRNPAGLGPQEVLLVIQNGARRDF